MPFLKHLIEPQLRQYTAQLPAREPIAPVPPPLPSERPVGYLQSSGFVDAPVEKTPSQQALQQLRTEAAQRTPMSVFRSAAMQAAMQAGKDAKHLQFPVGPVEPQLNPNPPTDKRGRVVIPMPTDPNAAVAMTEGGQAINKAGKKLGYLSQIENPLAQNPVANMPPEQLYRMGGDAGAAELQRRYGQHLKEVRANVDAQGMPTDKFPEGYFKGMSKEKRKEIESGVKWLREFEQGVQI